MVRLKVDGIEVEVPSYFNLLQACEFAGVEVPRFCFHERLSVAGNCRMCLVEVKGGPPKPQASCAMNVTDLRCGPNGELPEIFTKTAMVKKARAGVIEFLLINHPLDCPICDQGGECDLQDQAMFYGLGSSRCCDGKRAVEDKNIGPLVKTVMNRCIHCTRCVRFITEVAGVSELGLIGRGEDAEITSYLEQSLTSEMQGNIIDLCPVGALTSRPFAFTSRPWELTKTDSIDIMDALGSSIRIDTRGREVMRILPRINESINEEWISDKTRFVWDGLRMQRLDHPYVRINGRLQPVSWDYAFKEIKSVVLSAGVNLGAIAGDLASVEEIYALKLLMKALNCNNFDCRQDGAFMNPSYGRSSYIFNPTIQGIDEAGAMLIIGSNPRLEAAVLNARIRKRWLRGDFPIAVIGDCGDLRYNYEHLGCVSEVLTDLISGKNPFVEKLKGSVNPLVMVGQGAIKHSKGINVLANAARLAIDVGGVNDSWNGFAVLHTAASRVGALDLGFVPSDDNLNATNILNKTDVVFLLGADELDFESKTAFTIYIGSHGDHGAQYADVILPGAAYTEKSGLWVNTEGRVQMGMRANFPPGEAREDWAIISAIADELGCQLPFDSLTKLRSELYRDYPHFRQLDEIALTSNQCIHDLAEKAGKVEKKSFISTVGNFYLTNPIARSSITMNECSIMSQGGKKSSFYSTGK
ncbi:MAG: NADH-quinone oxidoreductase subunit G [Candidatus Liberibacter europaeus]|uniref:NADH-quinone oxidoreductase n=1 Tax=Candidatus Liberibacter europaeus TaxID=744859 RepID=A0A2T4VXD3_9HYPH|nr:NADH-quinone oxidoreductase subunit G [Candidatus Liberibacter europaeus]PTL86434.1 MAG: NADH-quinone oxidoreductase subunit G [Candidatus Liberibacter europaeus]